MDYEKNYPITQLPGKHVLASWTRGYRDVDIHYGDRLIGSVQGVGRLRKGVRINDDELGAVELKLSEKPVMLDVIIDGYHSPSNIGHPVRDLKRYATFFWILMTLSFIAGMVEIGIVSDVPFLLGIVATINVLIIASYVLSAILVGKGKPSGYYLGISVFALFTFLSLIVLVTGMAWGWMLNFFMVLRVGAIIMLSVNLKVPIAAGRHLKFKQPDSESLLDTGF